MFEIIEVIENNAFNSGFSLGLEGSALPIFNELKAYCDLHGYPEELNIDLYKRSGFRKYIGPTKQGENGIRYRFAVNALLDNSPASESMLTLWQEKYEDVQRFVTSLSDDLQRLSSETENNEPRIKDKESAIYEAVSAGNSGLADQIDEEILQIKREARRSEILLRNGEEQLKKLQPFVWCLGMLSKSTDLALKREYFKKIQTDFDIKLNDFSSEFKAYVEAAKEAGLHCNIACGELTRELANPFSKMAMRGKILMALDLDEYLSR